MVGTLAQLLEENSEKAYPEIVQPGDRRLQMRAIINRLRRWVSIDSFSAIQEPGWRDEYHARAAVVTLLIDVMERVPGRTPHEALLILEEGLQHSDPRPTSDAPPRYHEMPNTEERPADRVVVLDQRKPSSERITTRLRPRTPTRTGLPPVHDPEDEPA